MHRNGRTIKLSTLRPYRYSLPAERWNPTIVCDDCDMHCQVRHALVEVHRPDGILRCPGSGTKVKFDVTAEAWALALRQADHATESRRTKRVVIKPEPAVPTPLHRIAAAR